MITTLKIKRGYSDNPTAGYPYALVEQDGTVLYSQFCTQDNQARIELHDSKPERMRALTERYGEYKIQPGIV